MHVSLSLCVRNSAHISILSRLYISLSHLLFPVTQPFKRDIDHTINVTEQINTQIKGTIKIHMKKV